MIGIQVSEVTSDALKLDQAIGTTLRENAIQQMLAEIADYNIFKPLPRGKYSLPGYKRISFHFVFVIKFDLKRK